MHIISRKALGEFIQRHPDAHTPLNAWYKAARHANWRSVAEVRTLYPHADMVTVYSGNTVTIFNIGGNKYRLLAGIHYNRQKLFILKILTHREYDGGRWKETL